ncbi:hypothetical protein T4B_9004 [Trichinella pseudospiralis]|uniref:Uncharacterized protein n=1 Tax=Trichinella pseudospiralis TaxID=6337 RepID=A0A0V1J785_TRIPS|nr:hypothetical protein T4B_9004 [Trichinella pseudospiralis]
MTQRRQSTVKSQSWLVAHVASTTLNAKAKVKPPPGSGLEMADSCGSARLTTSIMEKAESHLPGIFVRRHQTSASRKRSFGHSSDGRSILEAGGEEVDETDEKMQRPAPPDLR